MTGFERETRELILESIREYARRNLSEERLLEVDENGLFPAEDLRKMYEHDELGIHLLLIPREYGGLGASNYDAYRVCEFLARIDLGIATGIFATFLGLDPIRVGGTPEQKEKWMRMVADRNLLVAYAATEAEAGSDLGALKTKAVRVVEDGKLAGYRISGSKQWISNGGIADIYLVLALVENGVSWFIVPGDAEGLIKGSPEDKHGIRAADTVAFTMDDVFVPAENLVGEVEGLGLSQAQAVFGYTRLMVAAFGLGAGSEALERAVRYSQDRVQAGSPLCDKQGYTHKLIVPHAVKLAAARAYIEHVAHLLDEGSEDLQTEGAIAKYFSTNAGNGAAEDAIQALGGYGYVREYMVEKIKRDVKITQIYEGTNEIMEMTIARNRWQDHLKSRSTYYHDLSREMRDLHEKSPSVGASQMAQALDALNVIFERCKRQKLTRNQHTLFKLGELSAEAEVSMIFCRTAALDRYSEAFPYDREMMRAMSRIQARWAAHRIVHEGIELVLGGGSGDVSSMLEETGLESIISAQRGLLQDMDLVATMIKDVYRSRAGGAK
ncbi:MAG: acyl-CoA dehydrogenase family protein [Thermoplasmatota archaeon]